MPQRFLADLALLGLMFLLYASATSFYINIPPRGATCSVQISDRR